ncbi:hypothetical protein ACFQVD_09755 [Streptosporangium amethystogenes subsp. fukuiense]|uniref:Uncharacterized protein n=1 Tax=Streptosporangium amethystogenes subsp. fukuiense TaxID=698418 RepID=A0ABW2SW89_9ACTN
MATALQLRNLREAEPQHGSPVSLAGSVGEGDGEDRNGGRLEVLDAPGGDLGAAQDRC